MSTVSLMTSLLMVDCSRFLPPRHKTLSRRLFRDVSNTNAWFPALRICSSIAVSPLSVAKVRQNYVHP